MFIYLQKLYACHVLGFGNFLVKTFTPPHFVNNYSGKSFKFNHIPHLISYYLLNFPIFTKHFVSMEWLRFCFFPNYLLVSFQIFYGLLNIFWLRKVLLFFVYQLFDNNWDIKSWSRIKQEFGFNNTCHFKWHQVIYALHPFSKKMIKETDNTDNLLLPNIHLTKTH